MRKSCLARAAGVDLAEDELLQLVVHREHTGSRNSSQNIGTRTLEAVCRRGARGRTRTERGQLKTRASLRPSSIRFERSGARRAIGRKERKSIGRRKEESTVSES